MFDGDLIAGPVPTMFAEDPEVTKDALKADIYKAHFDMAKFERVFLQPEHVVLGEAFEIVNEPRYDKNSIIIIPTETSHRLMKFAIMSYLMQP
jgi:hypothetical protein